MSSPRRIGLPETMRMRHESHFVDQLARPHGVPVGRLIPIEDIDPNPRQPRQHLGDLAELVASVREKGVLEPIVVRPRGSRFEIVAGERRYRAALEVGLAELPCVVRDCTDAEMMELALIENLQRKDLTAFEEADGLKALQESYGYTHEKMAERLGKSRSSITEMLSLSAMPDAVRELCRHADISAKSLLLQVVRQSTPEKMKTFVERLGHSSTRDDARRIARIDTARAKRGRPRNFVYRFQPREKSFSLALQFRKAEVPKDELIRALEAVLDELRESGGRG